MNTQLIPEAITLAAANLLAPYRPGLTPNQLEAALDSLEKIESPDELWSREIIKNTLNVSMPTVDRMLASGELPKVKIRGRVFVRASAVRAIIEGKFHHAEGLAETTAKGQQLEKNDPEVSDNEL